MKKINIGDLVYFRRDRYESWRLGKIVGIGRMFYIIEYQYKATYYHYRKLKWNVYKTR